MSEESRDVEGARALWFTRRDGQLQGPFPAGLIRRYLVLGRLGPQDEVSRDRVAWETIAHCPELVPAVVRQGEGGADGDERLMIARLREDERNPRERRAGDASADARDRRADADRRQPEPEWMLRHRRVRARTLVEGMPRRAVQKPMMAGLVLAVALLLFAALRPATHHSGSGPECAAAPRAGINWDYCSLEGLHAPGADLRRATLRSADLRGADLQGARLSGSDLSYATLGLAHLQHAHLQHARLLGAGLGGADLKGADLAGADLAYADLRAAHLEHARLDGARLDQAIWVDGRVCADGSVGACR